MKKILLSLSLVGLALTACKKNSFEHDASGIFEATEVIVSAQANGQIEQFDIVEGDVLKANQQVGYIDSTQLYLQKLQLIGGRKALLISRPDVNKQIQATREQIANAKQEKDRVERLLKGDAATQKQLDDINSQIKVLEGTLNAQMNTLNTSIGNLNEQSSTVEIQVAQLNDLLAKCRIVNPIDGTVLTKYTQAKEVVVTGRPLYKIADTKNLFLRAYIVAEQLAGIKTGQEVKVFVTYSDENIKTYTGKVAWIADKAEFTPKTIQTKDERQNLVYAVKIAVENTDGLIKIGMYGDADFSVSGK